MSWGQATEAQQAEPLPESIEELEELRLTIHEEMAAIEGQLAARKSEMELKAVESGQFDQYGKPMSDRAAWAEYNEWRGRATGALRWKRIEMVEVKNAIKTKRAARGLTGDPTVAIECGDDAVSMLAALHQCARRLAGRIGFDKMDARDQDVLDRVRDYLQHRG